MTTETITFEQAQPLEASGGLNRAGLLLVLAINQKSSEPSMVPLDAARIVREFMDVAAMDVKRNHDYTSVSDELLLWSALAHIGNYVSGRERVPSHLQFAYASLREWWERQQRPTASSSDDLPGELAALLNRYCAENVSGTPDFILAEFLLDSIKAFNAAVVKRADWRGEGDDWGMANPPSVSLGEIQDWERQDRETDKR